MIWPKDNPKELEAFYGSFQLGADGKPTAAWESKTLISFVSPFPLRLAWNPTRTATRIRSHRNAAQSLKRILERILKYYGSVKMVRESRLDLFGGCYQFRRISGSTRLSLHAYGAAIDLDPERNPLGKPYSEQEGMIPLVVVSFFEDEGWMWGGRFNNRPDCMHFQATS